MTRSVCAMLVALVAAGCGRAKAPDETVESDAPVLVHVAKAGPATVSVEVKAPGTTVSAPGAEIVITAPMQGRVAALPHGEGDLVKAGDLLVQFEIPSLAADLATRQSALAQARARVANTQAARDRLAGLLSRGIAARKEVDDAERDLAEAQAAVQEASAGLEAAHQLQARQRVTAPFDGVVVRRLHNPGDLVDASASDPILRFADPVPKRSRGDGVGHGRAADQGGTTGRRHGRRRHHVEGHRGAHAGGHRHRDVIGARTAHAGRGRAAGARASRRSQHRHRLA